MKTRIVLSLFVATALFSCSSRGGLVGAPATGGAGASPGLAGASGGVVGSSDEGGSGGATSPLALCPSRKGRRPEQLALRGADGADIILVHDDGTSQRAPGPGLRNDVVLLKDWVAAYGDVGTTTWKAQLFDSALHVRAEASGLTPPAPAGGRAGIARVKVLADGTASFDFSGTNDDLVLTPDGRVRVRPFFELPPDAAGWVGIRLSSPTALRGIPAMMNVDSGEIRRLSRLASENDWVQVLPGARHLYVADGDSQAVLQAVLIDESPTGARQVALPGFSRAELEVGTTPLPDGRRVVFVSLSDRTRKSLPLWAYDLATGALDSVLPDGALPAQSTSSGYGDGRIDVSMGGAPSQGGTRLWTVDLATGALLDYRAGLTVRQIHAAPGGPPQWIALTDGAKRIYRFDRASGALEDLHVAGDLTTSDGHALVTRDGRPLAVVSLDDGNVATIPGGESLPPGVGLIRVQGRWAVGHAAFPTAPWAPGFPLWRVDLETADARVFASPESSPMPLRSATSPLFTYGGSTLLADGRVGVTLYDGIGAGLFVAAPGGPWSPVGHRVRDIEWLGWVPGPAFAISAKRKCDCYGPLMLSWPPPPAGTPALLSGDSLQFVAPDGTDVFPPTGDEHLVAFADDSASCALVKTDANEWIVYDTQARTRRSLGRLEGLSWIADAR